ncbi:hypothetical protein U1Q18_002771, partial [Sarracenia purpurea var. burkii]
MEDEMANEPVQIKICTARIISPVQKPNRRPGQATPSRLGPENFSCRVSRISSHEGPSRTPPFPLQAPLRSCGPIGRTNRVQNESESEAARRGGDESSVFGDEALKEKAVKGIR